MEKSRLSSSWEKAESLSRITASVALPIALLLVGHMLQGPIREKESSLRLIETAAGLLQADGRDPKDNTEGLRKWAIAVIEKHSGIPFPKETKDELLSGKVQLPSNLTNLAAGPWGVVFGGDKTLKAAKAEMKNAPQWGLTDARIYLRHGVYRSVSFNADKAAAQNMLQAAIANVPKRQPYLVNLAAWCIEPSQSKEDGIDVTRCQ